MDAQYGKSAMGLCDSKLTPVIEVNVRYDVRISVTQPPLAANCGPPQNEIPDRLRD